MINLEKRKLEVEENIFSTNNFGDVKIIEYTSAINILVEFIDTGTRVITSMSNIKQGSIKDQMKPNVYNEGYMGIGPYETRYNKIQTVCYKRWKEILNRCYNPNCAGYKFYGLEGVTICGEWKNYQNFAKWWEENCVDESFALDKDLLYKGNKIYSPDTCCFIPTNLNVALTLRKQKRGEYPLGVRVKDGAIIAQINHMGKKKHLGTFKSIEDAFQTYKKEKEKCIKEYAEKYKDIVTDKVYKALINYHIEISD